MIDYIVVSQPRSGSNFVAGLLSSTGVAGYPEELNLRRTPMARFLGVTTDGDVAAYVAQSRKYMRTANGVFAMKAVNVKAAELIRCEMANPKVVRVRRDDKRAHAMSRLLLAETRAVYLTPEARGALNERVAEFGVLTEEKIDVYLDIMAREDGYWDTWAAARLEEPPYEVVYEEALADPEGTVDAVLGWLGVDRTDARQVRPLSTQQGGDFQREWASHPADLGPRIP